MRWLRQNAVLVVFLVAVLASFVVSNSESHSRDRAQHRQIVAACETTSARTALSAGGWYALAQRVAGRGAAGDKISAQEYKATADGLVGLIPAPKELHDHQALAQIRMEGHKYVLTSEAFALQAAGCEQANA